MALPEKTIRVPVAEIKVQERKGYVLVYIANTKAKDGVTYRDAVMRRAAS